MSEWIRSEDELPPDGKLVLCVGDNGQIFMAMRMRDLWEDNLREWSNYEQFPDPNYEEVTHWMPLPNLPE